jgi:hypothetical protein
LQYLCYISLTMTLAAKLLYFASAPIYSVFFFLVFNFRAQMFNSTLLVLKWCSISTLER